MQDCFDHLGGAAERVVTGLRQRRGSGFVLVAQAFERHEGDVARMSATGTQTAAVLQSLSAAREAVFVALLGYSIQSDVNSGEWQVEALGDIKTIHPLSTQVAYLLVPCGRCHGILARE